MDHCLYSYDLPGNQDCFHGNGGKKEQRGVVQGPVYRVLMDQAEGLYNQYTVYRRWPLDH